MKIIIPFLLGLPIGLMMGNYWNRRQTALQTKQRSDLLASLLELSRVVTQETSQSTAHLQQLAQSSDHQWLQLLQLAKEAATQPSMHSSSPSASSSENPPPAASVTGDLPPPAAADAAP